MAQLGNITAENMDLASLARPILAEFNREFDESVGVYTLKEITASAPAVLKAAN